MFASYVSRHGHAFIDRRLYLPKEWTDDTTRLKAAHVPQDVGFATNPQIARAMIARGYHKSTLLFCRRGQRVWHRRALALVGFWACGTVILTCGIAASYFGRPDLAFIAIVGSLIVLADMVVFAYLAFRSERFAAAIGTPVPAE